MQEASLDDRRKRLLYLSQHRGMKETDLLMGRFAQKNLETMNDVELNDLELILEEGDNDLLSWIMEHTEPPERVNTLVLKMIIDFRKSL
ncbi:MAG: succinate dehydrogenase assembly factor 2 [Rhodospirillales bacterium]|nr:succinate dehydrogenase assembly factor 2 [Rhodospirillales bacterium]